MSSEFEFCLRCGKIKRLGTICRNCTEFLSRKDKKRKRQSIKPAISSKKVRKTSSSEKRPRTRAIYSKRKGLEMGRDLELLEKRRTRAMICIRCKQPRANWMGIWIIPGGKKESLDPYVKPKRVFLCSECWSPYKKKKVIKIDDVEYIEDLFDEPIDF